MIQLGDTTQWIQDRGDETLRLDYDLTPDSLVWDVGAYLGDWTEAIRSRVQCKVVIFEPIDVYRKKLYDRFKGEINIFYCMGGLSDYTSKVVMYHNKDRSGVEEKTGTSTWCKMYDVYEFWRTVVFPAIHLMKINVEGDEYKIIPRMIETGMIWHVKNIQVQFHLVDTKSPERYEKIAEDLSKTHTCTWRYPFVWENWRLK